MLLLPGDEDEIGVHLGTAMMLSNIFSSWIMFLNFIILNIIIQFLNQSRDIPGNSHSFGLPRSTTRSHWPGVETKLKQKYRGGNEGGPFFAFQLTSSSKRRHFVFGRHLVPILQIVA